MLAEKSAFASRSTTVSAVAADVAEPPIRLIM